jgi:ATP-dependent Lhr-like helicase
MLSYSVSELEWAHPTVRDWFIGRFGSATEPQVEGWPHILAGRTTLISAPTGSGKTLAAFLACIDRLVRQAIEHNLKDGVQVIYVSPLKALSNDVQKNLDAPLAEISKIAEERGLTKLGIRTAVRTGDTLAAERQSMLRKPPHILVTTPESLYIMLTAEKSRAILRSVETVIVDEIHAVADDKRGAHLMLSLERLDALADKKPNRIGLSATQKPIEIIAQFLAGNDSKLPIIVNVGHKRELDIAVLLPELPLGPVASNEMWEDVHKQLADLAKKHRSTLVFANTRRQVERMAMYLAKILGEEAVAAHHGSLSRKIRFEAERKLKDGEIKILVATASLELGIDIGFVDLVCQIGSPRAIAAALQRIGRSGHWRGAIPKGRLFALTRDELVEAAALVRAIKQGDLDRLVVPEVPLDILAQQIVAACAVHEWRESELFDLVKRAYPYKDLTREQFESVIKMLSEGVSARRGRYGAYLMRDQVNGKLKGRRGARLAAITSGGAIPEANLFSVVVEPEGIIIGTLDEDFAIELNKGNIFLLGSTSWRVRRVESRAGRVLVEDAHGAPPTVPFWLGEGPARTNELSDHVSDLRLAVSDLTPGLSPNLGSNPKGSLAKALSWLESECGVDKAAAEQIIEYVVAGRAVLGTIPSKRTIVAERFFDEGSGGGMQLVIHAPFGGRINKAWGLALRKKFCRSFNFELQAAATDNGLNISLLEQHSFPLGDVFYYLTPQSIAHTLEQAALASPIFQTRWRWDATRSLALLRFMGGKKVPPFLQRMRSDDLLAAVFPDAAACQDNLAGDIDLPDHPLINEVMKDVLSEAMDLKGLTEILQGIADGKIECLAIDTPMPSSFAHEILNANPYAYLDDAPLEERRARAVELRRSLPDALVRDVGRLDPSAISQVAKDAWPDLRDADELHDFLLTAIALPETLPDWPQPSPKQVWSHFFAELRKAGRVSRAHANGVIFWVAAERAQMFESVYRDVSFETILPKFENLLSSREDVLKSIVQGWMSVSPPLAAVDLERLLALPLADVEQALLRLESIGAILRGKFTDRYLSGPPTDAAKDAHEWCDRRLLSRIHSLTITDLRKQIEPVNSALFMRWLAHWQHVAPGTQLSGERGTLEILRQLQGFEIAANAWETQILEERVSNYDPDMLDQLCLKGEVGWGRLSPHPAVLDVNNGNEHSAKSGSAKGESTKGEYAESKSAKSEPANREPAISDPGGDARGSKRKGRRIIPTSVAPITFFVREDADWMRPSPYPDSDEDLALSAPAKQIKRILTARGASFFADLARETGLLKSEVEAALWELVAAGIVTADGFDNLRALVDPQRRSGRGRARAIRPRHSIGRWSLLRSINNNADSAKSTASSCYVLLKRYGVVFRELLARETDIPSWRSLLQHFRQMEARGEIRGGRFVDGFIGEQFALPSALESLRAMRNRPAKNNDLMLSALDPLNLIGIILPGEKIPAVSSRFFHLPI